MEASLLIPTQEILYRRPFQFDEIQWPIVPFTTERTALKGHRAAKGGVGLPQQVNLCYAFLPIIHREPLRISDFNMSLQNKIVVVTGGATGIGFALAQSFAEKGALVVIGSRRQSAIDEAVQKSVGKLHGKAVDVGNRDEVNQFISWVESTVGPVDILVNAAGVNIKDRTMAAMQPEQWDQVMQINATGAYNCIHAVLPGMKNRKSGFIVNISSVTGKRAIALGGVAYAASKFAMTALGTCVANEVGGEGIRVTNVYPGEVDTPILDHRPVPVTEAHRQSILRPEDIAQVVVALVDTPARVHVPEIVIKPVHQSYY